MTDVAFLGTGTMGLPMARNLSDAGFVVHAYNRTLDRARPLQDDDVLLFDDPTDAASGCPVMVTMLADADSRARRLRGRRWPPPTGRTSGSRWRPSAQPGTERCEALADEHDVTFVDAPGASAPGHRRENGALDRARAPAPSRPVPPSIRCSRRSLPERCGSARRGRAPAPRSRSTPGSSAWSARWRRRSRCCRPPAWMSDTFFDAVAGRPARSRLCARSRLRRWSPGTSPTSRCRSPTCSRTRTPDARTAADGGGSGACRSWRRRWGVWRSVSGGRVRRRGHGRDLPCDARPHRTDS